MADHEGGTADGDIGDETVPRPHRRRWWALGVAAAVLLPLFVVLGTGLGTDPAVVPSPLLGKRAPAFSLSRLDAAGTLSTSQLDGRLYVVNFWASWCVPCREEQRALDAFYRAWSPAGVELIGVLYSDTEQAALRFRRELGGTWPIVDDPDGKTALDYGVFGVPETFVIDQRGVIMAKLVGAVRPGTLEGVMARLHGGGLPVYQRNDHYRQGPP